MHRCEKETSIGCLSHVPGPGIICARTWELNSRHRYVLWLGIEPATFWLQDNASTNWATLVRAKVLNTLVASSTVHYFLHLEIFSPLPWWNDSLFVFFTFWLIACFLSLLAHLTLWVLYIREFLKTLACALFYILSLVTSSFSMAAVKLCQLPNLILNPRFALWALDSYLLVSSLGYPVDEFMIFLTNLPTVPLPCFLHGGENIVFQCALYDISIYSIG